MNKMVDDLCESFGKALAEHIKNTDVPEDTLKILNKLAKQVGIKLEFRADFGG